MSRRKEVVTAAGALVCALAIGFAMQNTDSAKKRYGSVPKAAPVTQGELTPLETGSLQRPGPVEEVLSVGGVELTSATDPVANKPRIAPKKLTTASILPLPQFDDSFGIASTECTVEADAKAGSAAMVMVSLDAPCFPNERVTILHEGILISEVTDAAGSLTLPIPAFAAEAEFVIALNSDVGVVARTTVSDLDLYDRVSLQWRGDTGFSLHAREGGADYGDEGHVSSATPRSIAAVLDGTGGFMSVIGHGSRDQTLHAEIYTFPKDASELELTVEAEVTAANCGAEIAAQTITLRSGVMTKPSNVTFAVPSCDVIGDFLVLNNPLEDLKLASN